MKIIKKITSAIAAIIFIICLLLLALVVMTPKDASGNKRVNVAGYSIMNVLTGSMEPAYQAGDIVVIKVTDPNELKKGDVITFISSDPVLNGQTITHRIVDVIDENGRIKFETKGDNNPAKDEAFVSEGEVIGKVEFKIPFAGKAVNFLQTNRTAFFLIIILPMLLIMALEVKDIIKIARNGDDDGSEEEKEDKDDNK